MKNLVHVMRDIYYAQAKGCWGFVQIRNTGVCVGWKANRRTRFHRTFGNPYA